MLALTRELQPGILVNERLSIAGDFVTSKEYQAAKPMETDGSPVPWEVCQTLNGSWGYFGDSQNDKSWASRVLNPYRHTGRGQHLDQERRPRLRRRRLTSPTEEAIVACPKLRSIIEDHKARRALPRLEQISDPEPTYELYQPAPSVAPASPTLFDKVQLVAFITMLSLLWPLVLSVIANALYDDIVPPTIQIILLVGCAISFGAAYFDQLFLEGDS